MSLYCEKCQVNYTAREHRCLEKKTCQQCQQEKPIVEFPAHPSSMDGHKHICKVCFTTKKEEDKKQRIAYRIQQRQKQAQQREQRVEENTLFRIYGYRWKKEPVYNAYIEDWDEDRWVLYAPSGESITPDKAKEAIALLQIQKPWHPSTLWAKQILSLPNIVILDTETTGLGSDDEIIDIAIVDGQEHIRLNTLVQCQRSTIPKESKAIHHINELMLRNAPTFPQLWDRLMRFLTTREIIIYNAEYDLRMLRQTALRYHLPMPELRVHCLMEQYSAYVGQLSSSGVGYRSMKLAAACLHFHIPQPNAHRALADAQVTLAVLKKLAEMADVANEQAD